MSLVNIAGKIVIIFLSLTTFNLYGQKLTANYTNQSLTATLNSLSSKYNLKIAFDTQIADKTVINKSVSKASIEEALSNIVDGTGLKVQRMGEVYMIIPDIGEKKPEMKAIEPQKVVVNKPKVFVAGVVKDGISGEALPFASIFISKNHLGISTNTEGYFRIEMNTDDTVYFAINYVGYRPTTCKVLPEAKPKLQTIFLEHQIEELEAVVVRYRVEVFDNSGLNALKIKFCPSQMCNIPSLSELDISAPLQMLPGIDATNENAGGFSIRESPPDKTLLIYDGFTLYQMNHFFGAFSSINTKAVKDIQVYKNGYDAHSGGSAAGIIEITGKSGNMQKPVFDIGLDMLAADAKLEIPVIKDKCSFLFSGRRSFTDGVKTPLFYKMFNNARYDFNSYYRKPPAAFTSNADDPEYYYDDLNTKLSIKPSKNSIVSMSIFGSADKLGFQQTDIFPTIDEHTNWGTRGASVRWAGKFLPVWNSEFVIGSSKTSFNYSFDDSLLRRRKKLLGIGEVINVVTKSSTIESWLANNALTWNNTFEVTKGQKIEIGTTIQSFNSLYDYSTQTFVNAINLVDTSKIYHNKAILSSAWFQYQLSGENWDLKPGLRLSKYSLIKKMYPEFRMSAIYKISPSFTLKANVSNYFQFVNKLNIINKGDFRSAWVISDGKKMPVVSSWLASGGANYAITSTLNLDVEFYYKKTDNLISNAQEYRLDGNNDVKLRNISWVYNSKVKGMDVLLKQTLGNYQLWASYTLSRAISEMQKNKQALEYPSDEDQLHQFKLLNLLKIKNWNLSLSGIYGSGAVWDKYVLGNNLQLSTDYQKNSARAPAYYRIDGGLNYALHLGGIEIKIGSNFFNILNNKNVIQKFDQLSTTPLLDINQGINPLEENTVYGLGFAYNLFINIVF